MGKWVTEKEYDAIKALSEAGVSQTHIAKIAKRSSGTVHRIVNSDAKNFKEWRDERTKENAKYHKPKSKPKKAETKVVAKDDTLVRIAVALERLADAWEKTPTTERKNKFFK